MNLTDLVHDQAPEQEILARIDESENVNGLDYMDKNILQLLILNIHNYSTANEIIDKLIEKNIAINHQDANGLTAWHYCVLNNQTKILKKLLETNPNLNVSDEYGWTIAQYLIIHNTNIEIVALLTEKGLILSAETKAKRDYYWDDYLFKVEAGMNLNDIFILCKEYWDSFDSSNFPEPEIIQSRIDNFNKLEKLLANSA